MKSVYDVLQERGFVEQVTDEAAARQILAGGQVTCYIGFDPTATSLHIGSLVPIMSLAHMQRNGHRPIALVGGGTAMIGDPSGKTEMRQVLSKEKVDGNAEALKRQLSQYLDFGEGKALLVNNADWLLPLKYIEFLRDIGRFFSVNRMLAAESYRMRLETGLNFIEFNYMLLQAYDFLYLFQKQGCLFQMGGNDQWGNIVAGIDLVRRVEGKQAYGITFPLITTSLGTKMGKTEKGTVWLDGRLTSPHEYYQYWINSTDDDVERFMALFTFLPIEEVREVRKSERCRPQQGQGGARFRGHEGDPRGRSGRGGLAGRIGGLRDEARGSRALSLEHDSPPEGRSRRVGHPCRREAPRGLRGRHPRLRALPRGGALQVPRRGPAQPRAGRRLRQRRADKNI